MLKYFNKMVYDTFFVCKMFVPLNYVLFGVLIIKNLTLMKRKYFCGRFRTLKYFNKIRFVRNLSADFMSR